MDCCCGDPSCGYCQAAYESRSNQIYPFSFDAQSDNQPQFTTLQTILEVNEDLEDAGNQEEEEEDDEGEDVEEDGEEGDAVTIHRETDYNRLQIDENEKKRLRNTEAARRCREKIKKRTDDLEEELADTTESNDEKNQHRVRLLSQIGEQMRMLDILKARNPALGPLIEQEAGQILAIYKEAVHRKRKAIEANFTNDCDNLYQKLN